MPDVEIQAIRDAATRMRAPDGPAQYLRNAAALLNQARLGPLALTLLGISAVGKHNAAVDLHKKNVDGGVEHIAAIADALDKTANNWDQSDQPWVVR